MRKYLSILTLLLVSCEDVIKIDLPGDANVIVIEGWITDRIEQHAITISRTTGFSSLEPVPRIEDATVWVEDDTGNIFDFTHRANGIYLSVDVFPGVAGRYYQLFTVLANGDSIVSAREPLMAVPPIDSLTFDFFLTQDEENPRLEIKVYFPVAFSQDPAGQTNFYKWNVFRNQVAFTSPESLVLLEDRFINGNRFRNDFTDFPFDEMDTARVEIQSLSPVVFDFFRRFKTQALTLGTSTSSAPLALVGNLRNVTNPRLQVLGFFAASSVNAREVVIRP